MSRPPDKHDKHEPPSGPELTSPSLADITYRLMTGFAGSVDRSTITRIVRTCHRDLRRAPARAGSDGAALPELIERRARENLAALIKTGSAGLKTAPGQFSSP
ncbi:hypothetical protein [Pseudonocardia parietis]|uniref:Uncharacterized protein n=1 Tax=Pseudonocardia parietis TaxID=570936 RepID=A0ABS4VX66_9PSEU|nr:hypothetical protein [Pseudonocardia parietis]MBP2368505.1 hypothetical protein [Pseudonocardia parietis]